MKYFLAESFKSGHIPFWCPHYFCGSPFMSDIQSGVFYPLSLILALFPIPLGFNLYVVVHFFLGFCFFYLFITSLGLSRKAALLTSISYCYGGYTIATLNTLNNLSTAIWLPAILWSFTRAKKSGRKSDYFLTIVFLSMAILGGEPQLFILSVGILFFYALFSVSGPIEGRWGRLKYPICVILLIMATGLITLIQLGPTYIDYQHSVRLSGLSYEEASRFSLGLYMMKHLFLPLHFPPGFVTETAALKDFFQNPNEVPWLLTVYPGMIIAPLALVGVLFSFSRKTWVWIAVFLAGLVLALGQNTPVHELFYSVFPFFRFPVKFMFAAGFSMLVMAAYGTDVLFSRIDRLAIHPVLGFSLLSLLLVGDLYYNHKYLNPLTKTDFYQYHHSALQPIVDDPGLFRVYADKMPNPPGLKNTIINHHIKWQMMLLPNLGLLENLYQVGGVPALELRYQHQLIEILSKPWKERIRFLKLANVKYIISQDPLDKEPSLKGEIEKVNGLVYRVRDFLSRAWVVGKSKKIHGGTINDFKNGSFNPSESVLGKIDFGDKPKPARFSSQDIDTIIYQHNGNILIETHRQKPGILVVSESSYPGWKVYVDDKERDCLWLDLLFQGVILDRGKHVVEFKFRPKYFPIFLTISFFSLLCLFLCWIWLKLKYSVGLTNKNNRYLR